ncbi:GNAT family N-acetyltransferase [Kribbella sp. NBC_01245]|uniref:GNAT family N-acetyltransferase n=1 Tax=Kribbella sp. NBC_01245 TaxID=2903578 RepID=UPI002E2A9804|nr:GNAT family N-acetyltransferase [Kribbella sp. NBC_01245]
MDIRLAVPEDAEAVAALRRIVFPYLVMKPELVSYALTTRTPEEHREAWVATEDGEVVGWGSGGSNTWTSDEGVSMIDVYVHPGYRRRGLGTELARIAQDHLVAAGMKKIRAFATEAAVEFATRQGFEPTRLVHYSGADPRVLPEMPPTPADLEIVSIATVTAEQAYRADVVAGADEPGDSPNDAVAFEQWVKDVWDAPGLDKELSAAVMAGDEIASFTAVERDGDRVWSGMTGTIPAYRGRGLAKLVKSVALRRAAEAGVVGAFTSNDDVNGPMLAVNEWLGYRRVATHTGLTRTL